MILLGHPLAAAAVVAQGVEHIGNLGGVGRAVRLLRPAPVGDVVEEVLPDRRARNRMAGDALRARFAERAVLRYGAAIAAAAMAIVLVSDNGWIAFAGFAVVGAGLAPVAPRRINDLVTAFKDGGDRGASGAGRHIRRALVVVEVALAVMLVIGAGLLIRTVYNLTNVDAGFDRSRLVTFSLTLFSLNFLGDGLRDALDVRSSKD